MGGENTAKNLEQLMVAAANRASDALGELLNDEIRIAHSQVYDGNWPEALSDRLKGRENLLTISQTAFGAEPMKVSLVIERKRVGCLLDLLMGRHGDSDLLGFGAAGLDDARLDPTEIDALKETANIVTGSCVSVLGRELGLTGMSLPSLAPQSSLAERVYWLLPDAQSLCAQSLLKTRSHPLEMELMMSIVCPRNIGATARNTNGSARAAAVPPRVRHSAARQERT